MKRLVSVLWRAMKWMVILAISIELFSFTAVVLSNYIIYGAPRQGTRAVYDGYTLFLMHNGVWPTTDISATGDSTLDKVVWFFGGSTMRASTTSPKHSIASDVARELNAHGRPYHFNCFNFGVNSFNSLLEVQYLQKQFIEHPVKPNVVVFYDGANDVNYFQLYHDPYAHENFARVKGLVESYHDNWFGLFKQINAAFYASYTKELLDKFLFAIEPLEPDSPEVRRFIDLAVKRYDHAATLCAAYNAKFLVFLQPLYFAETCSGIPSQLKESEKSTIMELPAMRHNVQVMYSALAKALADRPYFHDIRNALCDRAEMAYTHDGVHNTDSARELIGQTMLPTIRRDLGLPAIPDGSEAPASPNRSPQGWTP
ncbi:SGNH/GDSL hydrolase family protein [Desulfovibrio inopinatus]|uniref:SGNH/GDSL hydrolase family protein n=1 Tax=Desulfovibrio inopinatus TaxID=102109 RepID=UPI000407C4ED|nr:SGNH/GDSL hydrolase family protein [Desulfovibrio inopinatus]